VIFPAKAGRVIVAKASAIAVAVSSFWAAKGAGSASGSSSGAFSLRRIAQAAPNKTSPRIRSIFAMHRPFDFYPMWGRGAQGQAILRKR
jgi:hypothetical protein